VLELGVVAVLVVADAVVGVDAAVVELLARPDELLLDPPQAATPSATASDTSDAPSRDPIVVHRSLICA
jgi:hypothetical protein